MRSCSSPDCRHQTPEVLIPMALLTTCVSSRHLSCNGLLPEGKLLEVAAPIVACDCICCAVSSSPVSPVRSYSQWRLKIRSAHRYMPHSTEAAPPASPAAAAEPGHHRQDAFIFRRLMILGQGFQDNRNRPRIIRPALGACAGPSQPVSSCISRMESIHFCASALSFASSRR